ncbi:MULTISPECIES: hypothetical protein [Actibacterium]|uniref:Uncharacterized protein n=1 Tax=Actibacterium naphthalenivorans TaxID=1614693 RepID=A0A840C985_9RHOB|nr:MULTISPECIES: hypothetical protein [Actibacterium]ALG92010.1 hypothetical protein TQ29_14440 [Actibacterium sp. EMB200-NS6]MBB4022521.1 hypothetical protein [Actibacterium naphthalenivorans]
MSTVLCPACTLNGYCKRLMTHFVTDQMLENSTYIRDLRNFAFGLNVKDSAWHEHLTNLYRDYRGWIVGFDGDEVHLDMEQFERPFIREWFRDFCHKRCPDDVTPRRRPESRERVRILATILTARFPSEALLWGVRAANDDDPPKVD